MLFRRLPRICAHSRSVIVVSILGRDFSTCSRLKSVLRLVQMNPFRSLPSYGTVAEPDVMQSSTCSVVGLVVEVVRPQIVIIYVCT